MIFILAEILNMILTDIFVPVEDGGASVSYIVVVSVIG
jgi:hypothetical protein